MYRCIECRKPVLFKGLCDGCFMECVKVIFAKDGYKHSPEIDPLMQRASITDCRSVNTGSNPVGAVKEEE